MGGTLDIHNVGTVCHMLVGDMEGVQTCDSIWFWAWIPRSLLLCRLGLALLRWLLDSTGPRKTYVVHWVFLLLQEGGCGICEACSGLRNFAAKERQVDRHSWPIRLGMIQYEICMTISRSGSSAASICRTCKWCRGRFMSVLTTRRTCDNS